MRKVPGQNILILGQMVRNQFSDFQIDSPGGIFLVVFLRTHLVPSALRSRSPNRSARAEFRELIIPIHWKYWNLGSLNHWIIWRWLGSTHRTTLDCL
ncbi:hypothetical protein B0F90DRAFT_1695456, partial [Multifurca ochricompacta]